MTASPSIKPPRVALFGVTGYASTYYRFVCELAAKGSISFVAAVIINKDQVPDIVARLTKSGVNVYDSADGFFKAEFGIDLCMIPVGIQWHARYTVTALHAGMNVLVEKPLAGSIKDAEAIRAAETATSRWVAVGFQDLYSTEAQLVKNQICAGAIGAIEDIRLIGLWPRPRSYFSRNHWAGRINADGGAALDSPLNNAFAHFVNLSLFLAGSEVNRSAAANVETAQLFRAHDIEMFDTAVIRGFVSSGARFWFGVSHATKGTRQPEIVIHGSEGEITWTHEKSYSITDLSGHRREFQLPSMETVRAQMFAAVLTRLESPNTLICTTAMASEHTRLIENIQLMGPPLDFPSDLVDWELDPATGSEISSVRDLAENLNHSFISGSPLALPQLHHAKSS